MSRSYIRLAGAAALLWAAAAQAAPTTEEKLEMLSEEVDRLKQAVDGKKEQPAKADAAAPHGHGWHGLTGKTTVGGYGELHYNNLDSKKEADLHRVILFLGHRFSDRITFFSELEVEHAQAGEGKSGGEVAMEQAYLNFAMTDYLAINTGVLLTPVGILNEVHEPPTFYGVERNPVETNIIPTTWREAGIGISGKIVPGLGYDLMATSGLKVDSSYSIRGGRQNGRTAVANDLAYTARMKWTRVPGVELAMAYQHQSDITQSTGGLQPVSAGLAEGHVIVGKGPLTVKALYAQWNLDGAGPAANGKDRQYGWYVEPSFKITPAIGVFARYNVWDNQAGNAGTAPTKKTQSEVGVNYWPHQNVVVKFDVMKQNEAANDQGFNLGVGYMF